MNKNKHLELSYNLNNHDVSHEISTVRAEIVQTNDEIQLFYRSPSFINHCEKVKNSQKDVPKRVNGLWNDICLELFISQTDGSYREYNFSLNGNWQCYNFTSYRSEPELADVSAPLIDISDKKNITIKIKDKITHLYNLCLILKDSKNKLNYFSINNPDDGPPDFHDKKYWENIKG